MSDEKKEKIYVMHGVNTAMHMLRPGARWEITNKNFTVWDDPRPCPSWQEVEETIKKIKDFEDSIDTIWTDEQLEKIKQNKLPVSL